MTRPPKKPVSEQPHDGAMSARIPWRERQGITGPAKNDRTKTSEIKPSQTKTPKTKASQTKVTAPVRPRVKKAAQEQTETVVPRVLGASRRRSLAATGPSAQGGRKKRGGRNKKKQRRAAGNKQNGRVTFGGVTLSVKALTVVLLAGVVALLTVPTLAQMWRQQLTYNAIKERVAATEAANEEMRAELERWEDPTYVASQARARLGYVRPGETEYMVADSEGQTALAQTQTPTGPAKPWVQILALTMQAADQTDSESAVASDIVVPQTGQMGDQDPASGAQSGGGQGDNTSDGTDRGEDEAND